MTDPRALLVEENLLSQFALMADTEHVTRLADDDVVAFHRDIDFPLFNAITGARFAEGTGARRARELVAGYRERGHPFLWWATPSTMPSEVDAQLRAFGLQPAPEPGMHRVLAGPGAGGIDRADGAVTALPGISLTQSEVTDELVDVFASGFQFPDFVIAPLRAALDGFATGRMFHVLARLDGKPVGCGTGFLSGPGLSTLGLYNIATVATARRLGVGHAVTEELLRLGVERGCTDAVLMASAMGRPTYERLGFVEVCQTPQYVWGGAD